MKRIFSISILAVAFSMALTSCSKDDDSNDSNNDCLTCTVSLGGTSSSTEICDNGDGSVTIISLGQETVIPNTTVTQASQSFILAGGSCN